ncbi:MAG TPA: hypothetical protein VI757_02920 [Bacteroidia bacterium]|nr:hypothetical protein [Bacteroidia bacterium]
MPDTSVQDYPENPLQAIRPSADGLPDLHRITGSLNPDEVNKRLS